LEIEDSKQYLEYLLDWCNDIYLHWENVKPGFSKQFDLRSLEEWEESYHELKGKLQADLKEDFDHYQRAKDLYDQLDILYEESYTVQEEVE
jgi:hypothetical protein